MEIASFLQNKSLKFPFESHQLSVNWDLLFYDNENEGSSWEIQLTSVLSVYDKIVSNC